ncbi:MAG: CBS domain-containing protein [Alphaproteobacteria bacterium]
MKARDVMTAPVVTVGPDTSVTEIARLLVERGISAVPVVDDAGRPVGIVSEGDLLRRAEIGTEKRRSWWLEMLTDPDRLAADFTRSHAVKASEIMTKDLVTVKEDTPLADVADILESWRIKRVPVVRRRRVVGIVSRANLLQALVAHGTPKPGRTAETDQALRDHLMAAIRKQPWAVSGLFNVVVAKRVAHLWGVVRSEEERQAMVVVAETLPGIRSVEDHLAVTRLNTAA